MIGQDLHQYNSSGEQEEEKNFFIDHDSNSLRNSPKIERQNHFNCSEQPEQAQPLSPSPDLPTPRKRNRAPSEASMNMNRGHWSTEQNKKYHWFLEIHYRHFVNRHMRRMDKIFKTMELFIGTRQAEQCRSHHQKMQKKYLNFVTIIHNLRTHHYLSTETEPINQDMQLNGVACPQKLATMTEMFEQQTVTSPILEIKERKKSHSQKVEKTDKPEQKTKDKTETTQVKPETIEQQKEEEVDSHVANMLEEPHHLEIGEISLYHEKDSYPFNNIFDFQ